MFLLEVHLNESVPIGVFTQMTRRQHFDATPRTDWAVLLTLSIGRHVNLTPCLYENPNFRLRLTVGEVAVTSPLNGPGVKWAKSVILANSATTRVNGTRPNHSHTVRGTETLLEKQSVGSA